MTERIYFILTIWDMDPSHLVYWREYPEFAELVVQEEVTKSGKPHWQGAHC